MDTFKPNWTVEPESEETFEARYQAALEAGQESRQREMWARSVRYEAGARIIWLTLKTDMIFGIPVNHVAELSAATDDQLAQLELTPSGMGLSCRPLDIDISVEGLILDQLGGNEWMRAMRRRLNQVAASAKSPKKAAASAENGKRGGRPKKAAP